MVVTKTGLTSGCSAQWHHLVKHQQVRTCTRVCSLVSFIIILLGSADLSGCFLSLCCTLQMEGGGVLFCLFKGKKEKVEIQYLTV